jgi:hypothetical protein
MAPALLPSVMQVCNLLIHKGVLLLIIAFSGSTRQSSMCRDMQSVRIVELAYSLIHLAVVDVREPLVILEPQQVFVQMVVNLGVALNRSAIKCQQLGCKTRWVCSIVTN